MRGETNELITNLKRINRFFGLDYLFFATIDQNKNAHTQIFTKLQ